MACNCRPKLEFRQNINFTSATNSNRPTMAITLFFKHTISLPTSPHEQKPVWQHVCTVVAFHELFSWRIVKLHLSREERATARGSSSFTISTSSSSNDWCVCFETTDGMTRVVLNKYILFTFPAVRLVEEGSEIARKSSAFARISNNRVLQDYTPLPMKMTLEKSNVSHILVYMKSYEKFWYIVCRV